MFKFDWTINIGGIISFIILLITLLKMYIGLMSRFKSVEAKVDAMWEVFTSNR